MAQGNAHSNPFVIAALGASASGLEAFEQYYKHVPSRARHHLRQNAFRQRVSQQYRVGDLPKTC